MQRPQNLLAKQVSSSMRPRHGGRGARDAESALRDTRDQAVTLGRDLAAGARVQELERQVADLGYRLTRADGELAAARAGNTEARAAAAASEAPDEAHEARIARLEEVITSLCASKDEHEATKRRCATVARGSPPARNDVTALQGSTPFDAMLRPGAAAAVAQWLTRI